MVVIVAVVDVLLLHFSLLILRIIRLVRVRALVLAVVEPVVIAVAVVVVVVVTGGRRRRRRRRGLSRLSRAEGAISCACLVLTCRIVLFSCRMLQF